MNVSNVKPGTTAGAATRSRGYLIYLIIFMGLVALMDQYLSVIKTTAIDSILKQYSVTPTQFSNLESVFFIFTFFIFLLNGLTDRIGRKYSILILILLMGLPALAIVFFTPNIYMFMIMYTLTIFATVSNMWTIPISEESPADKRAKYVSIVYIIGLIPLQALLPKLITALNLDWKWMYGSMFFLMIPLVVMWFFMKETKRYETIKEERAEGIRKNHFFGIGVINKKDIRYIIISAAIWICWLVYQFFYFWMGHYFMTIKGLSQGQWNNVLLIALLGAAAGGLISGWIMDKLGRQLALILGYIGLSAVLLLMAFGQAMPLLIATVGLVGFFTSFTYTWIVVYIPEIFPTERRGACIGWTTTLARISYVVGPLLVGWLLGLYPDMKWFWVIAAGIVLLPILIMLVFNPSETRVKDLDAIEESR